MEKQEVSKVSKQRFDHVRTMFMVFSVVLGMNLAVMLLNKTLQDWGSSFLLVFGCVCYLYSYRQVMQAYKNEETDIDISRQLLTGMILIFGGIFVQYAL